MIWKISYFIVFLSLRISPGSLESAYLKICGREHKHSVDSYQCAKGVWLKKPIEPGCVCVKGVWALSNGFCDEHAAILVGDGNCFHVSFEVRTIKLIGDPKDPFRPSVYMMPKSVDAIYEVMERNHTPNIENDETMIIGINPRLVAQRKDKKLCLDLEPDEYGKPVHIFVNPRRVVKEWTLDKKMHYNCPVVTDYQFHVGFGEMFTKDHVASKLMVARQCQYQCPGASNPNMNVPMGRWLAPAEESVKTFKTIEERNREKEEMRAQFTQDKSHYEKEVNEQTLRMMHAHISPILLNITTRQVVTHEYRYFQQIRKIVEKVCPQDFVPKLLVTGLMRMFRQLLWETQDEFFQHIQNNNQGLFDRIMARLQECEQKSPEPSIMFATYTDAYKPNATPPLEEPKPERCPDPIMFAVNGSVYNRTFTDDKESLFVRNYTNLYHPHLKFNASQVDFVIETAWKIVTIGHYRCSHYFDDQTAIEFSHFFSQVQSFFNPRIIKRWYYQQSVDATYDIVKMIFPSYDLKKFMFGLDSCVFGTQTFSTVDAGNVWLQRPKIPMTENDLTLKRHILPGATSMINTLDYAPDLPKPGDILGKRRKKRGIEKEIKGYFLWNSKARCLNDYMDPVRKREFGYYLPYGCVTPVPVDDDMVL